MILKGLFLNKKGHCDEKIGLKYQDKIKIRKEGIEGEYYPHK